MKIMIIHISVDDNNIADYLKDKKVAAAKNERRQQYKADKIRFASFGVQSTQRTQKRKKCKN